MPQPDPVRRSLPTRVLHVLLLAVVWQLAGSEFVRRPRPDRPANTMYTLHEIVGLATLGLVPAFWLWSLVRRREMPLGALLPWLSRARLKAVAVDLRRHGAMLRPFRLPGGEAETPPASAVHGLGLLAALVMGASGAWTYTQPLPAGPVLQLHKLMANLMWAYVVGHAGLAVLHQLAGHRVLQRTFGRAPSGRAAP